jgi:hypothetical protein
MGNGLPKLPAFSKVTDMLRLCPYVVAFALAAGVVPSAADERSLEDRLLRPDLTAQPNLGRRDFQKGGNLDMPEFRGAKIFATGNYETKPHETRRFLGIPIPWFGSDKKAPTKNFAAADREFVTKAAAGFQRENSALGDKSFADGRKKAYADARAFPVREAVVEGKDQKNLDAQGQDLSVEEVRELLNKR